MRCFVILSPLCPGALRRISTSYFDEIGSTICEVIPGVMRPATWSNLKAFEFALVGNCFNFSCVDDYVHVYNVLTLD